MKSQKSNKLNIAKVLEDFHEEEQKSSHRKGTFKIEKPFDEALDVIVKLRPESRRPKIKVR